MTKKTKRERKCEPYGRVPMRLNGDTRLPDSAVRVYVAMAANVWQGNVCKLSMPELARLSAVSRRSVIRAVDALIECGYISTVGDRREGSVNFYCLSSDVFAQKQGREDVIVSSPRGQRYVSMDNERHGLPPREECA